MVVKLKALKSIVINAISLALIDAGINMLDIMVSSSAGILYQYQNTPVVGLIIRF